MKLHSETYDSYKNAEGEWSETIPSEWQEKRVKDLFRLVTDAAPADNDYELLSLYAGIGVKPRKDLEARGNKASSTDGYWIVRKNDIVVNKLLAWMGSVGLSEYDGVTSPAYDVLRKTQSEVDPRYFAYLFRTETAKKIFRKNSRGIMDMRLRLYFDKLGSITVPFPSKNEQSSISDYIDTKTKQIDSRIRLLERKVELYNKLREKIIYEAITEGIVDNIETKESGVDWIGKIPNHWKLLRLKEISIVKTGSTPPTSDDSFYCEVGTPWVKPDELNDFFYIKSSKVNLSVQGLKKSTLIKKGSVLVCCIGSIGKLGVAGVDLTTNQQINSITFNQEVMSEFGKYLIFGSRTEMVNLSVGNVVQILNSGKQKQIIYPIPPKKEQKNLYEYLDRKNSLIQKAIYIIKLQIEALNKLKTTIIYDAVVGNIKIDKKAVSEGSNR